MIKTVNIEWTSGDPIIRMGSFRSFKSLCDSKGWNYNTVIRKGEEFTYKETFIKKIR